LNNNIKIFITDIDGVWTDAGMYYDNMNNELKKFNTKDSIGVFFLKILDIPTVIISSENTNIVKRRAKKLGISEYFLGTKNKLNICFELCEKYNIKMSQIAFIGDEINDLNLIKKVGLSACPVDAAEYIKKEVNWVLDKKGGEGVFREFVIKYIKSINKYDKVINMANEFYKNEK
tara:strand:+ start:2491 stop:3015 length:525 start_codon:yes stop_codon:yes gene_type:complete